jgi:hypothetical protein
LTKNKITISRPGSILSNVVSERANVLQIVTEPEAWTIGACANGFCDDLNDVALLIIDQDFPVPTNLRITSVEDLVRFRSIKAPVITYGYGLTRFNKVSFTPMSMTAHLEEPNPGGFGVSAFNILVDGKQNVCAGDSGGPSYVIEGEFIYYLGPTSGSRRPSCSQVPSESSGFYGGTPITLKPKLLAQAQAIALTVKTAADLKAKQEAEAKVASDLIAQREAAAKTAAIIKKITITCIKGKLIKKVTAVKPICPKGYRKK